MKAIVLFLLLIAVPAIAAPETGTFSIVACDTATGEVGVAVESRAFSVGTRVPWAKAGAGAVATQASTRASFGPRGIAMLTAGVEPRTVIDSLLADDTDKDHRQLGVVSVYGRAANFTGDKCSAWAGGIVGPGFAIQGNILTGQEVVRAMEKAFRETQGELSTRLLAALQAGQAAGGDKRGQQSAALLVVRPSDQYPEYRERYVSLRVEDHPRPVDELLRLYHLYEATGLAEAHARYLQMFESAHRVGDASRERARLGDILRRVNADPGATAASLNAVAWTSATANVALDDALKAATRAAVLEPKNTDILDTVAEIHLKRGEFAEALRAIQSALVIAPDDADLKARKKEIEDAEKRAPKKP